MTVTASPRHTIENAEIARIFNELADLLEIQNANPFRIRAYRTAARTIAEWPHAVAAIVHEHPDQLTELPGIGEDLAAKIAEIVHTGALRQLHAAERRAPRGARDLMRIPGLGPKRARVLCEALGVRSLAGLRRAARTGRIHKIPHFGVVTEQRILHELERQAGSGDRVLRSVAAQYGEQLLAYMRTFEGVDNAELAGSFRRCRDTVGDLDLLVTGSPRGRLIEHFITYPETEAVLAQGPTRASIRLRCGLQIDLRVLRATSYGAGLHYFTGSKAHNIAIRRLGQDRDLKINEYGVFRGRRRIAGATEQDVYDAVGLPWIPPELRENRGEIEAARNGTLPHLIVRGDIRGDLHAHTTDSDGRDNLEAMAHAAEALGYEYLAITDHGPSVRITQGLDAKGFRAQRRRIDRLNAKLKTLRLLAGAEVDILPDGRLELDDATLSALDIVVVALHRKLDLSDAEQTKRALRAIAHPSVDILAHPTGRLLNTRHGASFDPDAVFQAAADHGVMLEIDSQPDRLDLDDVAARGAIGHGVKLTIDSDAHAVAELEFMRWGVDQARRGWVTRQNVANTHPLASLLKLLHRAR